MLSSRSSRSLGGEAEGIIPARLLHKIPLKFHGSSHFVDFLIFFIILMIFIPFNYNVKLFSQSKLISVFGMRNKLFSRIIRIRDEGPSGPPSRPREGPPLRTVSRRDPRRGPKVSLFSSRVGCIYTQLRSRLFFSTGKKYIIKAMF